MKLKFALKVFGENPDNDSDADEEDLTAPGKRAAQRVEADGRGL